MSEERMLELRREMRVFLRAGYHTVLYQHNTSTCETRDFHSHTCRDHPHVIAAAKAAIQVNNMFSSRFLDESSYKLRGVTSWTWRRKGSEYPMGVPLPPNRPPRKNRRKTRCVGGPRKISTRCRGFEMLGIVLLALSFSQRTI